MLANTIRGLLSTVLPNISIQARYEYSMRQGLANNHCSTTHMRWWVSWPHSRYHISMVCLRSCRSQPPSARGLGAAAAAAQLDSEPLESTSTSPELSPPSLRAIIAARRTPQPSVVSEPVGPVDTALPGSDQAVRALGAQSSQCSTSSPTRHQSLDSLMSGGGAEAWQALDANADISAVWDKYEEVFYGDYHPVSSTFRR